MMSWQIFLGVLVHESAHIRRNDPWWHLIQQVGVILFWFHPLVVRISRILSQAREELCDNYVLAHSCPEDYAQTLVNLSMHSQDHYSVHYSLGLIGQRWTLEARVQGLLNPDRRLDRTSARSFTLATVLILGLLALITGGTWAQETATAKSDVVSQQLTNRQEVLAGVTTTVASRLTDRVNFTSRVYERRRAIADEVLAVLGEDDASLHTWATSLVLSPDEKFLYVSGWDGEVTVFDMQSLMPVRDFQAHNASCSGVALFHEGRRLVSVGDGGDVKLWDLETVPPRQLASAALTMTKRPNGWVALRPAPDKSSVAICIGSRIVLIDVGVDRLTETAEVPMQTYQSMLAFDISSDGRWLVTCEPTRRAILPNEMDDGRKKGAAAKLIVRSLQSAKPTIVSEWPTTALNYVRFGADNNTVYSGEPNDVETGKVHVWKIMNGKIAPEHATSLSCNDPLGDYGMNPLSFAGSWRASSTENGVVIESIQREEWSYRGRVEGGAYALLRDGTIITNYRGALRRWKFDGKEYVKDYDGVESRAARLVNMPTDDALITLSDSLSQWNLKKLDSPASQIEWCFGEVVDIEVWHTERGLIASTTKDGNSLVQGLAQDEQGGYVESFAISFGAESEISCSQVAAHPRKGVIATAHRNGRIKLWDIDGEPIQLAEWQSTTEQWIDLFFSPDGEELVCVDGTSATKVWTIDLHSIGRTPPGARWVGQSGQRLFAAAYSADGRYYAAGGDHDHLIMIWRVDAWDEKPRVLSLSDTSKTAREDLSQVGVRSLQFSSDGRYLLSSGLDGRVTLWELESGVPLRAWWLPSRVMRACFAMNDTLVAVVNINGTINLLRTPFLAQAK